MPGGWSVRVEHVNIMALVNRHNNIGTHVCCVLFVCPGCHFGAAGATWSVLWVLRGALCRGSEGTLTCYCTEWLLLCGIGRRYPIRRCWGECLTSVWYECGNVCVFEMWCVCRMREMWCVCRMREMWCVCRMREMWCVCRMREMWCVCVSVWGGDEDIICV